MPDPATLQTADTVRRAVTRLNRQLRRLRADHGVSAAKLSVLGQLYRAGREVTAVDLARLENLQPQSLTRIIAELEERHFLARRQHETDRRQILIRITPEGRDLLIQDAHQQTAWLAQAMASRMTETERALLRVACGLLADLAEGGEDAGETK
jgi:DNA-binding MarR family transcriptional regulator